MLRIGPILADDEMHVVGMHHHLVLLDLRPVLERGCVRDATQVGHGQEHVEGIGHVRPGNAVLRPLEVERTVGDLDQNRRVEDRLHRQVAIGLEVFQTEERIDVDRIDPGPVKIVVRRGDRPINRRHDCGRFEPHPQQAGGEPGGYPARRGPSHQPELDLVHRNFRGGRLIGVRASKFLGRLPLVERGDQEVDDPGGISPRRDRPGHHQADFECNVGPGQCSASAMVQPLLLSVTITHVMHRQDPDQQIPFARDHHFLSRRYQQHLRSGSQAPTGSSPASSRRRHCRKTRDRGDDSSIPAGIGLLQAAYGLPFSTRLDTGIKASLASSISALVGARAALASFSRTSSRSETVLSATALLGTGTVKRPAF